MLGVNSWTKDGDMVYNHRSSVLEGADVALVALVA